MNEAVYEVINGRLRPCLLPSVIRNSLLSEHVRAERWKVSCRELGEGGFPEQGHGATGQLTESASVKGFRGAPPVFQQTLNA